ncbi:MAG: sulfotransferase [Saprospiraceae bacterium]|nr:sulfotransferase [Saprospiraceae bacterium]
MALLIGGSPSTGSSLLRRILNRHSKVFCGSETALFSKEELYEKWGKQSPRLFRKYFAGLRSAGWHHLRGIIIDNEYSISNEELKQLLYASNSFPDFAEVFYMKSMKEESKMIWAEKTPSNVFCFNKFLKSFPGSKVIHIVRNHEDTIASLINRGMHVYDACVIYLLNTTAGLEYINKPTCLTIQYENLVTDPGTIVPQLCQFMEIPFESSMLDPDQQKLPNDYMEGWKYRETASIQSGSIGRFKQLDDRERNDITCLMYRLRSALDTTYKSIPELADKMSYDIQPEAADYSLSFNLERHMILDRTKRTLKGSYFNHFNYPVYVERK